MIQSPVLEKTSSFLDDQLVDAAPLESGVKNENIKLGMTRKELFCISYFMWLFLRLASVSSSDLPVDDPPALLLTHVLQITTSIIAAKGRMKVRKKERKQ